MYSKVLLLSSLVLAVCQAGLIAVDQGHGHAGHAVSSQSIIRHDEPTHQIAAPAHYATPILQHSAPIFQHSAPIQHAASIQHASNVGHHSAQILGHGAPAYEHSTILQHSAPLIQHAAPLIQHAAPLVHHSAPIAHVAPVVHHAAPVAHYAATPIAVAHAEHIEQNAPAKYQFEYSVEDPHTGDHKSQHEIRDGDVVKGEYSLLQPDGSIRKVEYTADHHNGFNAVVHNSAPSTHAAPAPAHHLAVHAAPLYASHH